jgi:hypothetical protein
VHLGNRGRVGDNLLDVSRAKSRRSYLIRSNNTGRPLLHAHLTRRTSTATSRHRRPRCCPLPQSMAPNSEDRVTSRQRTEAVALPSQLLSNGPSRRSGRAVLAGGRYWDRTSDLFGVNKPDHVTCVSPSPARRQLTCAYTWKRSQSSRRSPSAPAGFTRHWLPIRLPLSDYWSRLIIAPGRCPVGGAGTRQGVSCVLSRGRGCGSTCPGWSRAWSGRTGGCATRRRVTEWG